MAREIGGPIVDGVSLYRNDSVIFWSPSHWPMLELVPLEELVPEGHYTEGAELIDSVLDVVRCFGYARLKYCLLLCSFDFCWGCWG